MIDNQHAAAQGAAADGAAVPGEGAVGPETGDALVKQARAVKGTKRRITEARITLFLQTLTETSNISAAARAAQIDRWTITKWRRRDPDFAARFDKALQDGVADLKIKALEQGRFGVRQVETVEEKDGVRTRTVVRDAALTALREVERLHGDALADIGNRSAAERHALEARIDRMIATALARCLSDALARRLADVVVTETAGVTA